MADTLVGDFDDLVAGAQAHGLAQDHGGPHPAPFQLDADLFGYRFDLHRFPDPENAHGATPSGRDAGRSSRNQIARPGPTSSAPRCRRPTSRGRPGSPRRFRRLGGWGYGNLPDIVAVVILDRMSTISSNNFGGQHVEVVQQVHMTPGPHRRVIDFDEALGRKLGLWRPPAFGASRPSTRYRSAFCTSSSINLSRSGRRAMNWRESRCTTLTWSNWVVGFMTQKPCRKTMVL